MEKVMEAVIDATKEARGFAQQYEHRINQDFRGDIESKMRYEDVAYKEGMLWASIAQAEQIKRIADMLEGYLGVYADSAVFSGMGRESKAAIEGDGSL